MINPRSASPSGDDEDRRPGDLADLVVAAGDGNPLAGAAHKDLATAAGEHDHQN
jgi:hypothetical protein